MISTHKSNSAVLESLQRQIDKAKIEVHACDVVMGILREPKYRRFRALGRVVALSKLKLCSVRKSFILRYRQWRK